MQTVRDLYILTVILFIKGIGSNSNVKPEVSSPKYSDLDVCSDKVHTVLNENWREIGSKESNNCDQKLKEGWYRFLINGKTAQLPSLCIKNKACGTVIPLRLDLHDQQLPTVNHSISVSVCGSYTILRKWDCCVLRQPAVVHNCGMFYVYRLSPPDRCDVGYCVVSEENQMKMHVFTAKTGEPSSELPNPTYPTSTTTYIPSTAKDNRCSSNERQCPNGCVPLSQSCPMTLDLNTLRRRIVHTFDTIRQTHYFTHKTTTRKIPTATTSIETSSEQVTTTYQSQSLPERTTPSADITSSVFTTLITAMTTKEDNRANIKETDQTTINNTSHTVDNTASTSENLNMSTFSVYDLKTQRTLDLSTLSQPTTTMSESRETTSKTAHNSGFHENQNEQPVFEESYCGVTLAFKFEASYLQNVNFTAFRKKLQVIFASLLNIYYVDNYGVYIEGIFSWKTRYHRETFKTYTSSHVHFGRGIHNQSNYYITVFAEDIFNTDKVLSTLLQNSTVVHYIQEEIKEFHATFLNKTSNNTEMTSREKPSTPYTPLLYTNFGLCIAVFLPVSIFVVCALIGVLKIKSKNRCMNLRRKSGQYYVKWEKALKRDVCKGIGYTENPMKDKDIIKGENSVKQNLISPKDKDSTEEDDNVANDKRGKKLADDSSWVLPTKEFYNPSVVQGLHTKL
ncbi:uncharacterized protein LOC133203439 isoform X2 [Saccostrea echinata]|uniref:uncharacterized protein LOC133203439 isoform X2 n=1 Tax=Saccostrea echinata TaxID=191078 RepID=UPI002A81DDCE|nr:uncharacterized protein LOC133203439 isoform X2 [Saccostrea echinata]